MYKFNTFLQKKGKWFPHRVHTEWKRLLSGVHSIMMKKLAQAGEDGCARPPPFTLLTITYKVAVYASAEWADTLTLFHLFQYMYSVGTPTKSSWDSNVIHIAMRYSDYWQGGGGWVGSSAPILIS